MQVSAQAEFNNGEGTISAGDARSEELNDYNENFGMSKETTPLTRSQK